MLLTTLTQQQLRKVTPTQGAPKRLYQAEESKGWRCKTGEGRPQHEKMAEGGNSEMKCTEPQNKTYKGAKQRGLWGCVHHD